MLGRWNRGSRTSKNWWKRSIWSYLQHHACHLMSHQRRCQKKKSGILQSAGMVEKELQNDLSTLVRSVKIKSKHLKKWIPRWNEKKPLSVSITSGRRIDCGGWKLQLSKSDWDKSQRLKVFGRLYFDIQFIYLFEWWWCDWDFCDPLVYDSVGFHCGHWDLWMIFIATATGPMQILILVNILQVECQNKERTLQ